ncbi:SDR family NAD(P)-dependent oxidoreductase, partial [Streptomyces rishiriensis]|uniref:SDR family NAD(P)-dependent oxidoreductase n=1 Tax=Streptomyces rishiriensis TaxID=68264 RepID=UPI0037A85B7B
TDVDWPAWFIPTPTTPVDLPTYPFDHRSYWLAPHSPVGDARRFGLADTADHPLLGALVTPAEGEGLLLSGLLSLRTHPWLADHVIAGTTLLPGTAFLEFALQAARAADCEEVAELTLERPLVLPPQGAVQIHVVVQRADEQGHRALAVHARPAERDGEHDHPWTCHATGVIAPAAPRPPHAFEWLPTGTVPLDLADAYSRLADDGYTYGPAFQGLRAVWSSGADFYAEAEIAEAQRADAVRCGLHPALLDAVLHVLALDGPADGGSAQVPFSFTGVRLRAHGATVLRARLRRTDGGVAITLTDSAGEVVADVSSLAMRAIDARGVVPLTRRPLHTVSWVPLEAEAAADGSSPDAVVVRVPAGDAGRQAVAGVLGEVQSHLEGDERVVVVTASGDAAGAAVGGLVRSVQAEYPGRFFLVEAETDCGEEVLRAALASDEPHVRVRDGGLLAPRLTRVAEEAMVAAGPVFGSEGTVLVTGATGTLGRVVVRHLVERYGVRDVVLVSRSGRLPEDLTDLHDLSGVRLRAVACDVADREALAGVIAEAASTLRGVVHAAGVLDDATVANLTPERVARVWGPKAEAARHLHELTRDLPLDAFVLFSSAAGVIGTAGQANYAAANAFLDQLAADRHAHGLPAHSLAWGLWEETSGMTGQLAAADRTRLARLGIAPLPTEDALALFDAALTTEAPALVAAHFDPTALRTAAAEEQLPPLLAALVRTPTKRATTGGGGEFAERLRGLGAEERQRLVAGEVRRQVAGVLGRPDADAVPVDRAFSELGLDSLMGVDLRNRLSTVMDRRLPASLVFDQPTVRDLTEYLITELTGDTSASAPVIGKALAVDEPLAIVGMACRFPGGVGGPEDLWRLVAEGRDGISGFPADRGWDLQKLFHPDPDHTGTSYAREGGFLHEAAGFDAEFFGISPREALAMDPQQRLLLETAWEALEHARIDAHGLRGSRTGVFAGVMYNDYASRLRTAPPAVEGLLAAGNTGSVISGRLAYVFGFEGPAVSVDTACSSSLVALHLA